MQRADWNGVFPAITTPFKADDSIDIDLFGRHLAWMADRGCNACVTPGSLGEGGLLSLDGKYLALSFRWWPQWGRAERVRP